MKKAYSLLLASAILILAVVYAYDPLYVVAYIAVLSMIIYSMYAVMQTKQAQHQVEFSEQSHSS